jgi:hypothetical protein
LTLNLGVRWEHYGVPWEKNGLMASTVHGGLVGGFGYTGTGFDRLGKLRATEGRSDNGQVCRCEFSHPDEKLYKDDWNNVGPNVGFSWALPWFGENKTTLRGGYGISFQSGVTPFDLDTNVSMMPGINDSQSVTPSGFTNLANLVIPSAVVQRSASTRSPQSAESVDRPVRYETMSPRIFRTSTCRLRARCGPT